MISGAPINVFDYGAKGDGTTDDTVAIQAAINNPGKVVYFPAGTYVISDTLVPQCSQIIGEYFNGTYGTIIKPTNVVTKTISIGGGNYPAVVKDFCIDGTNTTNATGIFFGDAGSCACFVENLYVKNFTGSSAVGIRIGDMLKSTLVRVTGYANQTGILIDAVTGSFPTTVNFVSCGTSSSVGYGEKIVQGYQITHENCYFESSGLEGVYIETSTSDAVLVAYHNCWFEDNYISNATKSQVLIYDTGSRTIEPIFDECLFSGSNKDIIFDGIYIRAYLNMIQTTPKTDGVQVKNNANLYIGPIFSLNLSPTGYLTTSTGGTVTYWRNSINSIESEWTDWTPSYSGGSSMTFTSVTTNVARYKTIGKTLFVDILFQGTTGGTAAEWINFTLPSGITPKSSIYTPAYLYDSASEIGYLRTDGTATVRFYKTSGNWGLGAGKSCGISFSTEIN